MPNTIVLQGQLNNVHDEFKTAVGTIKPGHLVEKDSSGNLILATAAANLAEGFIPIVAVENGLAGGDLTTAYTSGEVALVHRCMPGDLVQLRLAAAAAAVVLNDSLVCDGAGGVKKQIGSPTDRVFAKAEEAVDNSAGGSEVFIKARILS